MQGAINLPISDTLAARFAFNSETRDSFYNVTGPNGGAYNGNPGKVRIGQRALRPVVEARRCTDAFSSRLITIILNFGAYPADPYYSTEDLFNIGVNSPQQALDRFGRDAS